MDEQANITRLPPGGYKRITPAHGAPYHWKPGQSGNPKGRQKKTPITDQLIKIFENEKDSKALAKSIVSWARKGSIGHVREILDRVDGVLVRQIEQQVTVTHELSDSERMSAENSLEKIAAFESESDTPLIAEVCEDANA